MFLILALNFWTASLLLKFQRLNKTALMVINKSAAVFLEIIFI